MAVTDQLNIETVILISLLIYCAFICFSCLSVYSFRNVCLCILLELFVCVSLLELFVCVSLLELCICVLHLELFVLCSLYCYVLLYSWCDLFVNIIVPLLCFHVLCVCPHVLHVCPHVLCVSSCVACVSSCVVWVLMCCFCCSGINILVLFFLLSIPAYLGIGVHADEWFSWQDALVTWSAMVWW
jgi:hypothetical protein